MRILVAEDNPESRQLLIDLLRHGGHSAVGVCNGREALDALEKDRFEVVFMDDQMPVMNGVEAAHAIRQKSVSRGKRPIIVGMSGNTAECDERRCLDAGMDAFLPKPIGMAELLAMLAVLARRPAQAASVSPPCPNGDQPPADLAAHLHRATGGNQKIVRSLIKNFLAGTPQKLSVLRRLIAKGDGGGIASAAHALKGSLGLFGAHRAVNAARNLQKIGASDSVGGAEQEFRIIEQEFVRLKREIAALPYAPKPKPRKAAAKRRNRTKRRR
ncbi:MAG TPA: response regulator [Candidatus Acidoferrum sp.]|nr:response regulator [Candidatus Acidoferrum sp.]